jgi:hypothetical protein
LFQFFCGIAKIAPSGQKLFSLIINELDTTFKNSGKFIWISQNKSSIFASSKSMKVLTKTKSK